MRRHRAPESMARGVRQDGAIKRMDLCQHLSGENIINRREQTSLTAGVAEDREGYKLTLSHTKPRGTLRRHDEANEPVVGILAPCKLSVIKKELTSCRRHETISHAEARGSRRDSRVGRDAQPPNPCVPLRPLRLKTATYITRQHDTCLLNYHLICARRPPRDGSFARYTFVDFRIQLYVCEV